MIKTDTPELGGIVGRQVLQEIPNIGRNFLALAGLVPGTTNGPPSSRQRDFFGRRGDRFGRLGRSQQFHH